MQSSYVFQDFQRQGSSTQQTQKNYIHPKVLRTSSITGRSSNNTQQSRFSMNPFKISRDEQSTLERISCAQSDYQIFPQGHHDNTSNIQPSAYTDYQKQQTVRKTSQLTVETDWTTQDGNKTLVSGNQQQSQLFYSSNNQRKSDARANLESYFSAEQELRSIFAKPKIARPAYKCLIKSENEQGLPRLVRFQSHSVYSDQKLTSQNLNFQQTWPLFGDIERPSNPHCKNFKSSNFPTFKQSEEFCTNSFNKDSNLDLGEEFHERHSDSTISSNQSNEFDVIHNDAIVERPISQVFTTLSEIMNAQEHQDVKKQLKMFAKNKVFGENIIQKKREVKDKSCCLEPILSDETSNLQI